MKVVKEMVSVRVTVERPDGTIEVVPARIRDLSSESVATMTADTAAAGRGTVLSVVATVYTVDRRESKLDQRYRLARLNDTADDLNYMSDPRNHQA